jgi:hypothetical protein
MPEPFEKQEITPLDDKREKKGDRRTQAAARGFPGVHHDNNRDKQAKNDEKIELPGHESRSQSRNAVRKRNLFSGNDLVEHADNYTDADQAKIHIPGL